MNNSVIHLHCSPAHLLTEGFHRTLNANALTHRPIIYVIHNNGYAGKIPLPMAFANPCLIDLAPAYRLRGARITMEQYHSTLARAEALCEKGHGPFIIELLLEVPHD